MVPFRCSHVSKFQPPDCLHCSAVTFTAVSYSLISPKHVISSERNHVFSEGGVITPQGEQYPTFCPPPTKPLNPLCVPGFAPFKRTAFLQKYLGERRSLDPRDHATAVYSRRQSIANGVNSQWCLVFEFFAFLHHLSKRQVNLSVQLVQC